ncbi:transcription factor MYB59-like isoform X1 [Juglans regia]|uniref:Transcription factor MYB59-like isoform X1 n=1 Tax=Juglans regia TaxID=51240 RepID=A0A6P9EEX9_JUGRE|nr:transcription factor MYB59-like isoform X1 [Juglans regia]
MKMVQEGIRKGPWTEREDFKLNCFVGLFGDRRWDFIAKVSGLNRTGKSCRLRWVNYLHPGLKRGKMTLQEERLVLELHSKWGNRWSRIAHRLPGRTDNEIKNYWRTHMRKQAQEKKRGLSPSSSSSNSCLSSASNPTVNSLPFPKTGEESFYDTGGHDIIAVDSLSFPKTGEESFYDTGGPEIIASAEKQIEEEKAGENVYSMDDIWKDIALSEEDTIKPAYYSFSEGGSTFSHHALASPSWEYFLDSLWRMDEEVSKMFLPTSDQFFPCYEYGRASLTG